MTLIISIFVLMAIAVFIIVKIEKNESIRYGEAVDYLETYGKDKYSSYYMPSTKRKFLTFRDTENKLHKIKTSDIILIGKLKNTNNDEVILRDNKILEIYG